MFPWVEREREREREEGGREGGRESREGGRESREGGRDKRENVSLGRLLRQACLRGTHAVRLGPTRT